MRSPTTQLLCSVLHKQGIRINVQRLWIVYKNHPLPHSIRSLSDTLDELQVENAVYRLEFEQLFEIEGAFIVVAGQDEYPFYIVNSIDRETSTIKLQSATGREATLTFDQFCSVWEGTVLLAEKGERTREDSWMTYWIRQGLSHLDRRALWWIVGLFVSLLAWQGIQSPLLISLCYLIKAAGIAISLLLVAKTSFDPHLAERFCRQGKHSDCNEVLHSAGAKLLGWVSLGELSLAYFTTLLLWGVLFTDNFLPMFLLLTSLALSFVVYSLAWQVYHHKWCPLCLTIDAVLVIDFVVVLLIWNEMPEPFSTKLYPDLVSFSLLFGLCLLAIRRIVSMMEQNQIIPSLKFKQELLLSDSELFWLLLHKQPEEIVNSNNAHAISNYVESEHTITVVMNPSCPKCAKVHKALASLQAYRINLVFIINDGDEHSLKAALVMLSAGIQYEWSVADRIIRAWYAHRKLPENIKIHPCALNDLEEQRAYCQRIHIEGTPTVLIDNRRLPELYDVEDLKVLL